MAQKLQLILFIGVCLWATAESTTMIFNPLTRQLTRDDGETAPCAQEGLICDDCTHVSECILLYEDVYLKQDSHTCDVGSCSNATGTCTTAPNPQCDKNIVDYEMKCRQIGFFPNPFSVCEYFLCHPSATESLDETPTHYACPSGYAYDAYSASCRIKLANNTTCPMLLQPCTVAMQRGGVPGHPGMYYICIKTDGVAMPQLFVCPKNFVYNETKRVCEEPVHITGLSSTGKCTARGYFYEGSSCFAYNECWAADAAPIKRVCPARMYFDEKLAWCVDFTCKHVN